MGTQPQPRLKNATIRDDFISGLQSGHIRQRILEDNVLRLNDVFDPQKMLGTSSQKMLGTRPPPPKRC